MTDPLLSQEPLIRAAFFLIVLTGMIGWELAAPRRPPEITRRLRWGGNLGIALLNSALMRLAMPFAAVALALIAEHRGWGVFNALPVPGWIAFLVSLLMLDLTLYVQHVLFHAVPMLWRFHRMHHADLEFDVTTGLRFHPVESLVSMGIKLGAVAALGAPAVAVLVFEIVLNATSMFNHGNVRIPAAADRIVRWWIVTPDMHRVHHSVARDEQGSNFGFNLPWWDRLFGTYRDQPAASHETMTIGLEQFRAARDLRLDRMLLQPFVESGSGASSVRLRRTSAG